MKNNCIDFDRFFFFSRTFREGRSNADKQLCRNSFKHLRGLQILTAILPPHANTGWNENMRRAHGTKMEHDSQPYTIHFTTAAVAVGCGEHRFDSAPNHRKTVNGLMPGKIRRVTPRDRVFCFRQQFVVVTSPLHQRHRYKNYNTQTISIHEAMNNVVPLHQRRR